MLKHNIDSNFKWSGGSCCSTEATSILLEQQLFGGIHKWKVLLQFLYYWFKFWHFVSESGFVISYAWSFFFKVLANDSSELKICSSLTFSENFSHFILKDWTPNTSADLCLMRITFKNDWITPSAHKLPSYFHTWFNNNGWFIYMKCWVHIYTSQS